MSVMKEWECKVHGCFESTHPLCPEIGCESEEVKQVFLTPPTISDGMLKRFNRGLKQSVDQMKLGNLRSARAGEASYGNAGRGMLWGADIQKMLGVDVGALVQGTAKPLTVTYRDGRSEKIEKSVMRELASEGITSDRAMLPVPHDRAGHIGEQKKDPFGK